MLPIPRVFLIALAFLNLTAAPASAQAPDKPAPPPAPRTASEQLLDAALAKLDKLASYSVSIRHEVRAPGTQVKSTGRLAIAPGDKVLYELNVGVGNLKGTAKIVCDGETIWRYRFLVQERILTRTSLAELNKARQELKTSPGDLEPAKVQEILDDIDAEFGFTHLRALLLDLKRRQAFATHSPTTLTRAGKPDVPVYLLEGTWNAASLDKFAPAKKPDDPASQDVRKVWDERRPPTLFIPRRCRVFLARDSLWPYRIEWWGPTRTGESDELLVALDLDPDFNPPPASVFALTAEEKQGATSQEIPAAAVVTNRRDLAVQQKQLEEAISKSPLAPVAPAPLAPAKK